MKEDWIEAELGEICDFVGGGTPSKKNPDFWNGDLPWASIKDIKGNFLTETQDYITKEGLNNSSANLALPDEIILATRINPGKSIVSKIETAINQDLKVVKPKIKIDSKFLFLSFKNSEKSVVKISSGTTVLGVNLNNLKSITFSIPPLPIQRAIVTKIENLFTSLDKGIADLKKAQEQLKVYRQAVLKKAFEGDWKLKSIKEVCKNIKVGIVIKPTKYYSKEKTDYLAFRSANVREFRVEDSNWIYFTKQGIEENKRTQLELGDVLIVRSGYPGTSCIVTEKYAGANAIDILIATPNSNLITSKYLCAFNNSPKGKGLFSEGARGVAQKHLNVGVYSRLLIPIPSLKEQNQIVKDIESRLSVCDKIEQSITETLEKSEALRQSILKKAFEGKLLSETEITKCKQEADYEPASVLLERIKKEKHGK